MWGILMTRMSLSSEYNSEFCPSPLTSVPICWNKQDSYISYQRKGRNQGRVGQAGADPWETSWQCQISPEADRQANVRGAVQPNLKDKLHRPQSKARVSCPIRDSIRPLGHLTFDGLKHYCVPPAYVVFSKAYRFAD